MDAKASRLDVLGILGQDEAGRNQRIDALPHTPLDILSGWEFAADTTETDKNGRQFRGTVVGMPGIPAGVAPDGDLDLRQTDAR